MPIQFERRLQREARAKGYGKARSDRYVYGTLRKFGWRPRRERGKQKKRRKK